MYKPCAVCGKDVDGSDHHVVFGYIAMHNDCYQAVKKGEARGSLGEEVIPQSCSQGKEYSEPCYVCGRIIHTDRDFGFSSTIRHGGERVWFHLVCSQDGDPVTAIEVEAEQAKYG